MSRDLSFRACLDAGQTKEQLMKRFSMTENEFNRVIASLQEIRKV